MEPKERNENPYASPTASGGSSLPTPASAHSIIARVIAGMMIVIGLTVTVLTFGWGSPILLVTIAAPLRASAIRNQLIAKGKRPPSFIVLLIFSYVIFSMILISSIVLFVTTCSVLGKQGRYIIDPTPIGLILATLAALSLLVGATVLSFRGFRK